MAISTASACMWSFMSALLMMAFFSAGGGCAADEGFRSSEEVFRSGVPAPILSGTWLITSDSDFGKTEGRSLIERDWCVCVLWSPQFLRVEMFESRVGKEISIFYASPTVKRFFI